MKELICIICPNGCHMTVDENGISGGLCARGKQYVKMELTAPTRTLTTTMIFENAAHPRISVKSSAPLPKNMIFDTLKLLNSMKVSPPIQIGDIILRNVHNTGVNIVATKTML